MQYADFEERHLDGMLDVAIDQFGGNYIDRDKILSLVNKDNAMSSLAVDRERIIREGVKGNVKRKHNKIL